MSITNKLNEKIIYKKLNSILDMLRWASSQFNASNIYYGHGTDNFWDEALHLILPSLHLPIELPEKIYNARLTSYEKKYVIKQVILRTKARIPVPYLTNRAWFCGIELYVNQQVFIPRSPIGELITSSFHNLLQKKPQYILDMCTGTGSIAIATALHYPNSEIDAVDISNEVLKITEHNIKSYALENRIVPIQSNLFKNVPKIKYDLILANPPYVNEQDLNNLPKEFHFEPKIALCAGNDALNIIRKILFYADYYLSHDGILICEAGNAHKQLKKNYPQIPFHWINCKYGGYGIFMLTRHQLTINKEFFKKKNNQC